MTGDLPRPPQRSRDAHKGACGDLLIVAGSRRLAGAAALAVRGSARSGIGFVRLATPASLADRMAAGQPSAIVLPQRETAGGEISFTARPELLALAEAADALALGPGLGRSDDLRALVGALVDLVDRPLVLDADGLFALAGIGLDFLRDRVAPTLITPHPGEAARLLGCDVATVQGDREAAVRALAKQGDCVALLKGADTLVCRGDEIAVNASGHPGMATAGTGDVLTGIIGALLATGMDVFAAARLGAWLHGRAGELAAVALGNEVGMLPEDLAEKIPAALAECAS